jgi:uncharacterized protein (UPF0333 family)
MKTKTLSVLATVAVLAIGLAIGYLLQSPDEAPKSAKSVVETTQNINQQQPSHGHKVTGSLTFRVK